MEIGLWHRPADVTPVLRPADTAAVLLVDDEPSVRAMMRAALAHAASELQIWEASSGAEAFAILGAHAIDLIVLDLGLPDCDGLAVCRAVKENPATQAVFISVVTARILPSDRQAAFDAGADEFVVKPFSPRALTSMVSRYLDRGGSLPFPSS